MDSAVGRAVVVVVNDERSLSFAAVGIGEDIFIDCSVLGPKIVEYEVGAVSEESAVLEQGSNLVLMTRDQSLIRIFVHASALELHPVALGEALYLTMAKHR